VQNIHSAWFSFGSGLQSIQNKRLARKILKVKGLMEKARPVFGRAVFFVS
jgi:hypothetical protein